MLLDGDAHKLRPASRTEAIRRLEALYRFIQKIPAKLVNLDSSNDNVNTDKEIRCGSVGCIAGWGVGMADFKRLAHVTPDDDNVSWLDLRQYLGLPQPILVNDERTDLFDSGDLTNGRDKKAAIARIRAFITHYRRAPWATKERRFARV